MQSSQGSWGTTFEFADTATATETLGVTQPLGTPYQLGLNWLLGADPSDNDELARKLSALKTSGGLDTDALVAELVAAHNDPITDPLALNYPEGGWGLASGYSTDSLTTALVLDALAKPETIEGLRVVDEVIDGGEALHLYTWDVPDDAQEVTITVQASGTSGLKVGFSPTPPPVFTELTVPAGGSAEFVWPDLWGPVPTGLNYLWIIHLSGLPGNPVTYTMSASVTTPLLDTRIMTEGLDYLAAAQNPDGGWGLQVGSSSSLYTTMHVLHALRRLDTYDVDTKLAAGIAYLMSQQLTDGSFGYAGVPVPYMTALGALALVRNDGCPFSTATEDGITALLGQQAMDGSWAQEPYDTALALRALREYDKDGDGILADGDCSGVVGDNPCGVGVTVGCDDNCVDYANPGQGAVVFGENIRLTNDESLFYWTDPTDIVHVSLDPAQIDTYSILTNGSRSFATSFYVGADAPTPTAGFYYLVRPGGDCSVPSWATPVGAELGRDVVLP